MRNVKLHWLNYSLITMFRSYIAHKIITPVQMASLSCLCARGMHLRYKRDLVLHRGMDAILEGANIAPGTPKTPFMRKRSGVGLFTQDIRIQRENWSRKVK